MSAVIVKNGQVGLGAWVRAAGHRAERPRRPRHPVSGGRSHPDLGERCCWARASSRASLNIDDPMSRWVPDFPIAYGDTVRQVLAHSSERRARSATTRAASPRSPTWRRACSPKPFRAQCRRLDARAARHGRFGARAGSRHADQSARASSSMRPGSSRYEAVSVAWRCPTAWIAAAARHGATTARAASTPPTAWCPRRAIWRASTPPSTMRVLLTAETLSVAWSQANFNGAPLPTGLGWFVQNYQGEKLVWQFSHVPDAYSATHPQDAVPPPDADHAGQQRRSHHGRESRSGRRHRSRRS